MRERAAGGWRRVLLGVPAAILAAAGLWVATIAGAEENQTVRAKGYGPQTCDRSDQTLDTRITKAPKRKTDSKQAKLKFEAFFCRFPDDDPADPDFVDFKCGLDGSRAKNCKSPVRYRGLKKGKHVFEVRAAGFTSGAGGGDPTPDKAKWKIK